MSHKIRNLVSAAGFAIGITAAGGPAMSVFATSADPTPNAAGASLNVESANGNSDDGDKGQSGVQGSEGTVNDNKDDAEKDQIGVQRAGDQVNTNMDDGASGQPGAGANK